VADRSGKPPELYQFYRSLHARGESTELLAVKLNVSGSVVRRLIGLLRRRRGRVWNELLAMLTPPERELLSRASSSPEWSATQAKKRPIWNPEKLVA
jgi:hypothetical protein